MAVLRGVVKDNGNIIREISLLDSSKGDFVGVEVFLPEYTDFTSMLALHKRMLEVQKVTGLKLRLLGKTTNVDVEKYVTRLFSECDNIYMSVDWRDD